MTDLNRGIAQGLTDEALRVSLSALWRMTPEDMPPPLSTGQARLDDLRAAFQAEADRRERETFPWDCGCGERHRSEANAMGCRKCRKYLSVDDYHGRVATRVDA